MSKKEIGFVSKMREMKRPKRPDPPDGRGFVWDSAKTRPNRHPPLQQILERLHLELHPLDNGLGADRQIVFSLTGKRFQGDAHTAIGSPFRSRNGTVTMPVPRVLPT